MSSNQGNPTILYTDLKMTEQSDEYCFLFANANISTCEGLKQTVYVCIFTYRFT